MDSVILAEKLESLRRCVRRLEEKRAASADALAEDPDRQDILSLNISRAVQLCVHMAAHVLSDTDQPAPQSMGEAFDLLAAEGVITPEVRDRMRAAVGFRNVAVHQYQDINWAIVHGISHAGLEDFRQFAKAMSGLI
ncbi:DUF86 domain-containing protein [Methylonatrum kenyense]|uniref:type VII toxin-antitoxin system HepT family RNase toxin n=1 Tax=Methylonatrum kenyense TaxID=455253 RepID=UPI0020BF7CAB|nr:DUF86 domain-containing protein [Methylonatrum kenyense]MCK8516954.1 DUF86 domain-containing protein [Methylonatrum kenyense]